MKPRRHWWVWIIVGLYIWMIFRNSLMIAEASSALSAKVAYRLIAIINRYGFYIDFYTFHHYVRKLAHFAEFAGLGFLVTMAMHICPLFRSRFLNFVLFLIAIPAIDEGNVAGSEIVVTAQHGHPLASVETEIGIEAGFPV